MCKADGCGNKASKKRLGGFYAYCRQHRHQDPEFKGNKQGTKSDETANSETTADQKSSASTTDASEYPWGDQRASDADKKLINLGKCNVPSCDKPRKFSDKSHKALPTCGSHECRKAFRDKPEYTESEPCRLCGSKDHKVLNCEHLTEDAIAKLKAEHKYEHSFRFWKGAANILAARKTVFGKIKPQHMQNGSGMYKYAHGKASIGPIQRPVYFDLGGEYDLIDDMHYDEIIKCIKDGDMRGAEIITPEELGHSSRGVPVDLACSTSASGSSIAWITRWVRVTVEVTTKAGRKFILTQVDIGFVRRSTPLLILGKNTCTLCG